MNPTNQPVNNIIEQLQERAKELHTLYKVHELTNQQDTSIDEVCQALMEVVPAGWQYPSVCWARITLDNTVYQPPLVTETPWVQRADITAQGEKVGFDRGLLHPRRCRAPTRGRSSRRSGS